MNGKDIKILIVDDDSENRDVLKTRLKLAGYEVKEAANGDEGLQAALKDDPSLVILDIMMPKKNGWQVLKSMRLEPKTKNIPVIILTALTQPIVEMRSWESGAGEFLAKPVDHEALIAAVQKLLKEKETCHREQESPSH